jgi:hypothetical protein
MRRYRATFSRESESAAIEYECYDEGEPDDGDCKVVLVEEPLAPLVEVGADPQDVWKFIFRAGWHLPPGATLGGDLVDPAS